MERPAMIIVLLFLILAHVLPFPTIWHNSYALGTRDWSKRALSPESRDP